MSSIELRGLRKVYPPGITAVDGVDLRVDDGEVVVLLGPTGCGKTTVLRLIAGLEVPTEGTVLLNDEDVGHLRAGERGVALVFQGHGLFPHLSAAENIGFPLRHLEEPVRTARIHEVARMLELTELLHRRPSQLSGGQRQRVAIARAIARPPRAFLLDQPLTGLDAASRDAVGADLVRLVRSLGLATVYVTHDHQEALRLGDRVAVMRRGRIEQIGTPDQIYAEPQRLFVAAFVGSPRMNLLQAAIYAEPQVRTVVDLGAQIVELPWDDPRASELARFHTARITVGVRPDALALATREAPATSLDGVVRAVELRGHEVLVHLETGCSPTPYPLAQLELQDTPGELIEAVGSSRPATRTVRDRLLRRVSPQRREEVSRYTLQPAYDPSHDQLRQAQGDLSVMLPAADAPRVGDTITVALRVDKLYFFDSTGTRIRLSTPPAHQEA